MSGARSGCGARSLPRPSPTFCSSGRPTFSYPSSSRTRCTAAAARSGLSSASAGSAHLLAAAVTAQLGDRRQRPVTFMYVAWTGATLLVAGYGLVTRQWQLAVLVFVVGALEAAGTVVWATLKQRLVPGELLGRVSSIDWFVSTALMPLSYFDAFGRPLPRGTRHVELGRHGGGRGHFRIPVRAGHAVQRRPDGASRGRRPVAAPGRRPAWPRLSKRSRALSPRVTSKALSPVSRTTTQSSIRLGGRGGRHGTRRDTIAPRRSVRGESAYSWDVTQLWASFAETWRS